MHSSVSKNLLSAMHPPHLSTASEAVAVGVKRTIGAAKRTAKEEVFLVNGIVAARAHGSNFRLDLFLGRKVVSNNWGNGAT